MIVSEALVRRYFAGQNPLGQHLLLGRKNSTPFEIVGVAGDVHHNDLRSTSRPEIYLPIDVAPQNSAGLVIRTAGNPGGFLPAVQRRIWALDPDQAANLAAPVEQILYRSLSPARTAAVLLTGFAILTLLLGLIGIYGVLSYSVAQRTREIGIRLALGATRLEVLRLVLVEAAALACVGALLGIGAAVALSRYLGTILFGINALDPATYAVLTLALIAAALFAAFTPARRATLVDPAISLQSE